MTEHDEFEHEVEDDEKGTWHLVLFVTPWLILCATIGICIVVAVIAIS
jgi:hypothetical protein